MGYAARNNARNAEYRKEQRQHDERLSMVRMLLNPTERNIEEPATSAKPLVDSTGKPLVTRLGRTHYLLIDDGSVRNVTRLRQRDLSGRQRRMQQKAARRAARAGR